jgi:hypothetical protein
VIGIRRILLVADNFHRYFIEQFAGNDRIPSEYFLGLDMLAVIVKTDCVR